MSSVYDDQDYSFSVVQLSTRLTNKPMSNKEINCSSTIKSLGGFPTQPKVGQYPYVKVLFYW
jgi:hypothetical protein